tara:strand:- start:1048 stop:1965 length:918 start_codon:yes stop_codon:yes gene_type:complete
MNNKNTFDLIVVLGATATGKTKLAVQIANELNGEIISADSRQIYKKMDIGTGKDYNEYSIKNHQIKYHLIDILEPQYDYSVYQFQKDFKRAFDQIKLNNKVPILCGGTGLYIESVLLDYALFKASPNLKLRQNLEKKSLDELRTLAGEEFLKNTNDSEINNKRRIIRFIEKLNQKDQSPKQIIKIKSPLILGTKFERDVIRKKISIRLLQRLEEGLIEEVKNLIKDGISYERLESIGLEYKFVSYYLKKQITIDELIIKLTTAIQQFAKRQLSWYRRMERRSLKINWIENADYNIALDVIRKFKH